MNILATRLTIYVTLIATTGMSLGDDTTVGIRIPGCRIKPADHVTLSINESGIIDVVPHEGDQVESGQEVARLQDEVPRTALAVAQKEAANDVEIRFSEIASEVAELEHQQSVKVNQTVKGSITIIDIRRRKLEFDQSVMRIELAKYNQEVATLKRDQAAAHLGAFRVTAPFSGTVNKVLRHKGEAIRQGDPVLEIVNTKRVRVEGFLDASKRRGVTTGMAVQIEPELRDPDGPAVLLNGKIAFIDTVVQPVTQQVRIWADVDNTDESLLPGQTAQMTIAVDRRRLTAINR
ncbi:MAG TPA: HlyD family efflux transporter periplasmic adaptor subunit [Schlesneria sp.]|jgi:multidrug efflux pump subunit AcrA (membrane-fusion protein)